jgi:hypothetical protein
MRRIPLFLALFVLAAVLPTEAGTADAATSGYRLVTFQLHVNGPHDPRMTFWVAYGPLGGRFGLIQLHSAGTDHYIARRALPSGQTVFSYVAGTGTVQTRQGRAPGYPSVTIARVGPTTAARAAQSPMVWQAPLG